MVDPFEEVGASLLPHAESEVAGESICLEKAIDVLSKQMFGFVSEWPVEGGRSGREGLGGIGNGGLEAHIRRNVSRAGVEGATRKNVMESGVARQRVSAGWRCTKEEAQEQAYVGCWVVRGRKSGDVSPHSKVGRGRLGTGAGVAAEGGAPTPF